jgi:hypothetical protein
MTYVMILAILTSGCAFSCTCSSSAPAPQRDAGIHLDAEPPDSPPVDSAPPADSVAPTDAAGHGNGSFAVSIRTDLITSCTRAGADLTEISVALVDASGACLPVVFRLVTGAGAPVPSLPEARSQCPSSPARFPCFEPDTLVSVQGLEPGGYHLVVEGTTGDRVCWKGDASLGVSDTPDEQSLTLLRQPGC